MHFGSKRPTGASAGALAALPAWRLDRARCARGLALWAAGLFLLGVTAMAHAEKLDPERTAQLEHGTVDQRAEVLLWLAEHGDQTTAHEVVLRLKDPDAAIRDLAEHTVWAIWMRSGDPDVNRLMQKGIALMGERDYDEALAVFSEIIHRDAGFAEGYNKRATLYYMMGDYLHSLADVDATLKANPEHFGALSGAGLCLLRLSRPEEALQYFDRALSVNPNMDSIRFMAEQLRKQKPKPLI
jgi:tetratricopeptide (TPR) repeat protein